MDTNPPAGVDANGDKMQVKSLYVTKFVDAMHNSNNTATALKDDLEYLMNLVQTDSKRGRFPVDMNHGAADWNPDWSLGYGEWEPLHDPAKDFDPKLVQAAKQTEYQTLRERGTYKVVSRSEMDADVEAIKVSCKWVITNKGTATAPVIKRAT